MRVLAIIPAKTDSKRLPKKNLQLINGKSLVDHSIDYAIISKHQVDVVVSTEDRDLHSRVLLMREQSKYKHVYADMRNTDLCGDAEVVDVYIDLVEKMDDIILDDGIEDIYDIVVALQPDHPDREHTLDVCIAYFVDNNYDDLITVEENYKRSGSVRIFKMKHLLYGNVSKRIGILKDNATDIHYKEDLEKARQNMQSR